MADMGVEELRQIVEYDAASGRLFWRKRLPGMIRPKSGTRQTEEEAANKWNKRYAGQEALTCVGNHGYRYGRILGHTVLAHRLVWALVSGEWPSGEIDHKNGDRLDNRLCNLRDVTPAENGRNKCIDPRNTSGTMGVSWQKGFERWYAYINAGGRRIALGYFVSIDEAVAARKCAEGRLGFHANHGRPNPAHMVG